MRQRLLVPLLLVLLVTVALSRPVVAAPGDSSLTYRLLRTETEMARKGQIYLVADLAKKQIEVRFSGLPLTVIPIEKVRAWGPFPEAGLHILKEKDKLPEREKIRIPPPEGTPAPAAPTSTAKAEEEKPAAPKAPEIQAYEVSDMPTHYDLFFEGGAHLYIDSPSEEKDWKSNLRRKYDREWWFVTRSWTSLWNYRRNSSYTELLLVMQPRDAQRLYWVLAQGGAFFILPPAATP